MSAARPVLPQFLYILYRSRRDNQYEMVRLRPYYRRGNIIYCYRHNRNGIIDIDVSMIRDNIPDIKNLDDIEGVYIHPLSPDSLDNLNAKIKGEFM